MFYGLRIRKIEQYTQNLPIAEIKDYSVITDWKNLFDQPVKNKLIAYENIKKLQLVKEMIPLLVAY